MHTDRHQDPVRDWLVLVAVSAVVLIGTIVWNAWTFNTIAKGGVIGTPSTRTSPTFSRTSLNTIRAIFDSRAAEQSKYVTGEYHFTDPSL